MAQMLMYVIMAWAAPRTVPQDTLAPHPLNFTREVVVFANGTFEFTHEDRDGVCRPAIREIKEPMWMYKLNRVIHDHDPRVEMDVWNSKPKNGFHVHGDPAMPKTKNGKNGNGNGDDHPTGFFSCSGCFVIFMIGGWFWTTVALFLMGKWGAAVYSTVIGLCVFAVAFYMYFLLDLTPRWKKK